MSKTFPTLGIKIDDRQVTTYGFSSHPLGSLAGAYAEISDSTRHRRVAGAVTTTVLTASVAGPLGMLGLLSKKSKAFVFVSFSNGRVHEKKLDGNMQIRAAQREVAQFNALAAASGSYEQNRPSTPAGTCPGCGEPIEKIPGGRVPFVHTANGDFACPKK